MSEDFPIDLVDPSYISPDITDIIGQKLTLATSQKEPCLIHMLGVPGAGKTTVIHQIEKAYAANDMTLLGFDQLMGQIPRYKEMAKQDEMKAFDTFELPARQAGYYLLSELMNMQAHILFDHGGSPPEHIDLISYAQKKGYRICMVHVKCSSEVAKRRVVERGGRYTPSHYVDDRQVKINDLIADYKKHSDIFIEVDNKKDGAIHLPSSLAQFLAPLDHVQIA